MDQEYVGSSDQAHTKLELFFSCRNLADLDTFSKSDPYVVIQIKNNDRWEEYGRTEIIYDNLNPTFAHTVHLDYYFELSQALKFSVYDYDGPQSSELIGLCETSLAAIAGAKNQIVVLDIFSDKKKKSGKLIVRADPIVTVNDRIYLTIEGYNVIDTRYGFWRTTSPFLRLYRCKSRTESLLIFETEFIHNSVTPSWKPLNLTSQKLCNGDHNMPIRIELWDHVMLGNHSYLGDTITSVFELKGGLSKVQLKNKNNKIVGELKFSQFKLVNIPSFMDYIAGGTQINLIIAIDFTASNKVPSNPASLHYRNPNNSLNQYQQAIMGVGEILIHYDNDQNVPVFGFGCKPQFPGFSVSQTLHCFPINGFPENPDCHGLSGIMKAYDKAVSKVIFDGPTYFNPIISEALRIAKQCKGSEQYFVLLILTDGEIHDTQQTINSIVEAYNLPLSIIIIGVGDADFSNMDKLDNDDGTMKDDQGDTLSSIIKMKADYPSEILCSLFPSTKINMSNYVYPSEDGGAQFQ